VQANSGGKRFLAILIDTIVLAIIFFIMAKLFGKSSGGSVSLNGGPAGINFLIDFLYFIVLEAMMGATLGKMAMGLKVVKADGSPLGWGGSIIRNVFRIIDGFPYFIPYLLGAIVMWVSPKKQRLGDMVAGTLVVPKDATVTSPVGAS
jgi:uncharacterized RDD family membrane protein YckC